jgi:carbonic anhydrase
MSSPTQRTLAKLRSESWPLVQVTEKWNQFARVRQDLFGFIDCLAIRGDEVLAVQTTSAANVSARIHKLSTLPAVSHWLESATRKLVIHGWAKRGAKGKAKRWTCREVWLTRDVSGLILVHL